MHHHVSKHVASCPRAQLATINNTASSPTLCRNISGVWHRIPCIMSKHVQIRCMQYIYGHITMGLLELHLSYGRGSLANFSSTSLWMARPILTTNAAILKTVGFRLAHMNQVPWSIIRGSSEYVSSGSVELRILYIAICVRYTLRPRNFVAATTPS